MAQPTLSFLDQLELYDDQLEGQENRHPSYELPRSRSQW